MCARIVRPAEVAQLAPIPCDELVGALHCGLDVRVDPRRAVAALAALLADDPGVRILWSTRVHAVDEGVVSSTAGTIRAPLVIACPGPRQDWLGALAPTRDGLTRCKLQMLRVRAPANRRYGPALLTGLSLLRYPGFSERPGADRLRARLAAEVPELIEAGIHLIVTQLLGGDLLIGDSHEYGRTISPFGYFNGPLLVGHDSVEEKGSGIPSEAGRQIDGVP